MVKLNAAPLAFSIVLHLLATKDADALPQVWFNSCNNTDGNYTINSKYQENLYSLFTKTASRNHDHGFYSFTAGHSPDTASLISLCTATAKTNVTACHACQKFVTDTMKEVCPTQKTAIAWSDDCMVRYSKQSLYGVLAESPAHFVANGLKVQDDNAEEYTAAVNALLEGLPGNASAGDARIKFATAQYEFASSLSLYGMVQKLYAMAECTPDLSREDCSTCITDAIGIVQTCYNCYGAIGARALLPSCIVRFEPYKFYSAGAPTKKLSNGTRKTVVGMVVGLIVFILAASTLVFVTKGKVYWKNLHTSGILDGDGDDISNSDSFHFNFSTIRAATGNFSEANRLGQGGFGTVYKGMLHGNRQEIAVKRLAGNSSQGEEEFKNEIKLLAKLQHRNLVRLLGFCLHDKERLLIYEFVPNASLDHYLFGETRRGHLDWESRYQIIRGIARGVLYLQEDSRLRIIHRDIKASNVLLDVEMCPKIADFGTARLFDIHQTHSDTRRIVGTYGYMAPEYALYGNFSTKSDVYSFGMLLLEIVSGNRCSTLFTGEIWGCLISLVWRKWSENRPLEVVDSSMGDGTESEILRCIHIGLLCVQDNMAYRPTMSSIVRMMSSESITLPNPLQPAYVVTEPDLPLSSQDILSMENSTGCESITELHVR